MAQLKEDEWPGDGEPTTSEQEGDSVKREGSNPSGGTTPSTEDVTPGQSMINNVEPHQQGD